MGTTDPKRQAATAYLPGTAYFAAGRGTACDALRRALVTAGFIEVLGPNDARNATEFWITPPGKPRTQISPPGTTPRESYDLLSEIQLIVA